MTVSGKSDQQVIIFPTNAHLDEKNRTWVIPIRGWIFEPEKKNKWRKTIVTKLITGLNASFDRRQNELLEERMRMFFVNGERRKKVTIRVGDEAFELAGSARNGQLRGIVRIDTLRLDGMVEGNWMRFEAATSNHDRRRFVGRAQLLGHNGVSVVSDIDDTIKVSQVADRRELLANTFLREFKEVPGMAGAFQRWAQSGLAFHYVSTSPWPLYPFLSDFVRQRGFPPGSFHLRPFRLRDHLFSRFIDSVGSFKLSTIKSILHTYPSRKFILVGDSAAKDPDIYAPLARQYPQQILHIFIRNASASHDSTERCRAAFEGLPSSRWTVFIDPGDLVRFRLNSC